MAVKILAILALLCSAHLEGVQLTGELIHPNPSLPGLSAFTLNGPNFSLTGVAVFQNFANICFEGCSPGDEGGFNTVVLWDTSRLDSATVDGVTYSDASFGDVSTPFLSNFYFHGPAFTVTESLVYTAPFTLDGFLIVFRTQYTCIVCDPPTDLIDPTQPPLPLLVTGAGRVTMTLREDMQAPTRTFVVDRLVYQLIVPEPSAFFLVGIPLAAALVRRLLQSYS